MKYHPDKNPNAGDKFKDISHVSFNYTRFFYNFLCKISIEIAGDDKKTCYKLKMVYLIVYSFCKVYYYL
jgi:hypothetical protein